MRQAMDRSCAIMLRAGREQLPNSLTFKDVKQLLKPVWRLSGCHGGFSPQRVVAKCGCLPLMYICRLGSGPITPGHPRALQASYILPCLCLVFADLYRQPRTSPQTSASSGRLMSSPPLAAAGTVAAVAEPPTASPAPDSQHSVNEQTIGLILAVSSSIFIGASFIVKKRGLRLAGSQGIRAGELPVSGLALLSCWHHESRPPDSTPRWP